MEQKRSQRQLSFKLGDKFSVGIVTDTMNSNDKDNEENSSSAGSNKKNVTVLNEIQKTRKYASKQQKSPQMKF